VQASASHLLRVESESPSDIWQYEPTAPTTSQGTSGVSKDTNSALARDRRSRVTLNKIENARLFEWCAAHEVGMTNGAARKRAVVEVVASAHFHLVMGRKQDKYFSIDTEYGSTVMQSLTAGNIGKLLKNFFKTYIVGIKLQRDENGEECASRCEGLGKDTAARQLLDEAVFLCHSMVQGDTDSLAPSSAGLETAKKPKRPSGHGAKSKTNASEKGFSGNIAKKAKRKS
jgi:hypothetical protein